MNWPSTKAKRVLAALKRIGWVVKRQSGSHRILERDGWPDYVFAFHDGDNIGPVMLARIGKRTGLTPDDFEEWGWRMDEKIQVYVPLLKEGTTVWRPVIANPVSDSFFLLVGPVPDGEQWKFQPGELVRCEYRVFASGDRALAAEERADTTPRNSIH